MRRASPDEAGNYAYYLDLASGTALDIGPAEMGRRAATMLNALIEGTVAPGATEVLQPRLNLRESTARHRH